MGDQITQADAADAAELAHYGYEQVLERRTGKFASFAVAFASSRSPPGSSPPTGPP